VDKHSIRPVAGKIRANTRLSGILRTKRSREVRVSKLTRMFVPKPKNALQSPAPAQLADPALRQRSVLSGEVTLHSERMGKVNSIRRRNTICDWRRYGCALVQDVVDRAQ